MSTAPRRLPLAHRYFFALKPDEVTARRTQAFAERECPGLRLLPATNHHVTLAITGDFEASSDAIIAALVRAGDVVSAAPFELVLDRLTGSHRSVALRPAHVVPALRDLQGAIAAAMVREGVPMRLDWSFSPHQTLGYGDGHPFSRLVPGFTWPVGDFVLVHSFVGLTRHATIKSWALRDAQPRLL